MIPGKHYTPEVILAIVSRRKWLIVIPAILVAVIASAVIHYLPNRYHSESLILVVPQRVPESYVRTAVTTRIDERLQAISQQILSRTRLERLIQEFNLYTDRRKVDLMEDIVERMRKDIDVDIVKGDAFRVGFTADDPRVAMRVTERLASFFIDENLRDRETLAENTNQFLESQLEEARRKLVENEKQLEEYRRKHDGQLPTQLDANMQGLHNTEMQLQALVDSLNRDRDRRATLERQVAELVAAAPADTPATRPSNADDAVPAGTAAEQLRASQTILQGMLLRLKPEHPDVLRQKRIVAALQKRADDEAGSRPLTAAAPLTPAEAARQNRLHDAKAEMDSLDRQIGAKSAEEQRLRGVLANYQQRIEAAPAREAELSDLTRDYDTFQQNYRSLLVKKQESQVAANLERRQIGEQFKTLDAARLPEKPSSPDRPKLYALGVIAAIAIGLALAAVAEYRDNALRSEEDVKLVLNLLVLATVPILEPAPRADRRRRLLAVSMTAVVLLAGIGAAVWKLFLS